MNNTPSSLEYFVHEKALAETKNVGRGTRIWAFAHLLPGAKIGENCNICDNVFIENDVLVGSRVTIKCGVQLWDGTRIEDDVFIGPNATFTNDKFPRSRNWQSKLPNTLIRRGASIGANATILPGLEIGEEAMIGAGAVVTRNVPPFAIAVGNPCRIIGYVGGRKPDESSGYLPQPQKSKVHSVNTCEVKGVTVHSFPEFTDIRGDLTVGEFEKQIPFLPRRYFLVYDVPSSETRGEHAHLKCEQFLVCVAGAVSVVLDDGVNRREFLLDSPHKGLYIPPKVWGIQYKYTATSVLLVFASHSYDADDYIRSYERFKEIVNVK